MSAGRIAVLGGGMLGVCTALMLARRGQRVTLVEGAAAPLEGASRWNEGKIHLGFLYAADPSMRTAAKLIPGGLAFRGLVEELTGRSLSAYITSNDICLVHRDSVVDVAATVRYARRNMECIRDALASSSDVRYFRDLADARIRALSPAELAEVTSSPDVLAGFEVPEHSISTVSVADMLMEAISSEPLIEVRANTRVTGIHRRDDARYDIVAGGSAASDLGAFNVVVNALWEGRPAVDASLGIMPPAAWSHRFRAGIFARLPESDLRNAVLITGPFGDTKRYADGRVYLSWYPVGLLAEGEELEPPRAHACIDAVRRDQILAGTLAGLARYFPSVLPLAKQSGNLEVRGGWVYALGQGSIGDPASTLHARDRFNMTVDRGYISVDTAKYSLAPWLASRVTNLIMDS